MQSGFSHYISRITRSKTAMAFVFLALGFAIYAPSLNNRFLLDDEAQVLSNDLIHSPANIDAFFLGSTMHQEGSSLGGIYYKPIMSLSYSVLWWLWPENPTPYHVYQLLIAIANAFLLWRLLRRHMSEAASIVVSAAYLAHPINSEVVVYIADLQDVLYTFFGLAALNFIAGSASFGWKRFLGCFALLFCALLSKESGVLYLVTGVLYAAVFHRAIWRRVAGAGALVLASYLYLRIGVAHLTALTYHQNQIGRADLLTRLTTAPKVLASYLWKFVFPRDITITQDWVVREFSLNEFWLPLLFISLVLGVSVWYALRYRRENRGDLKFAFFTFWVFMGMGFHSHILAPLDGTTADRWFYFATAGLFAMIGLLIDRFVLPKHPRAFACAAAVILAALSARSAARALDWYDNFTICEHDLKIFEASYDMHNNLGVEYFRRGDFASAKKEFERSVELAPGWDINWNNLGAVYNHDRDFKKAEECYLRSMSHGTYYMAYENYASVLIAQRRYDEAREFIETRALPMFPASRRLGELLNLLKSR